MMNDISYCIDQSLKKDIRINATKSGKNQVESKLGKGTTLTIPLSSKKVN